MKNAVTRLAWGIAAPAVAVTGSIALTAMVLLVSGADPLATFRAMIEYGSTPQSIVTVINKSIAYYMAGIAAAIGFKMLLFNIGIDGQYRLAVFVAAVVGGSVSLPAFAHVALIILVAVGVGALWASIAGYLKVRRGVSEVISTIMLNSIATGLIAFFLNPSRFGSQEAGSNNVNTKIIGESGRLPGFVTPGGTIQGFVVVAIIVGIAYWVLLNKARFGFDLRASGMSLRAAMVSGVNGPRMVWTAMLMSGGVAGLVGMGTLLGNSHSYGLAFPAGYGLSGLAIALLGRNHPVGVLFGAILWSFLERSSQVLDLNGVSKEIVTIMQGVIVISVVVAYEVVKRIQSRRLQQLVRSVEDPGVPLQSESHDEEKEEVR
jgi:general nucleoside transport system permease protein